MTTYTVIPRDGDTSQAKSGLTADEAFERVMTDDGARYEIRPHPADLQAITDDDDLAYARARIAALDLRDALCVGASWWHDSTGGQSVDLVIVDGRAGLAANGPAVWGDWSDGVITVDGGQRLAPNGWYMWVTDERGSFVQNGDIFSVEEAADEARAKVVAKVLFLCNGWLDSPSVLTDAEYAEVQARIAADVTEQGED